MSLTYGELKERAAAVTADIAAARSARNRLSRRKAEDEQDEREAERGRRRQARKNERELEELLRRKVRVRVPLEERPKVGATTARSLYHRAAGMLLGVTGLTDARGPDGLYSIHFAFTARGFASTTGRRWRRGEAERAARYIVREEGLERGELGWWSNIAADRNELVAFYRIVEALERHDRSNANVYISEVIALPAELSARQRRRAVRRICRFFEGRGLSYTVAIHVPDATGDRRNFHCHILYSLRPCERVAPYEWNFGVAKTDDINTPAGIMARRVAAVQAINKTLKAAGVSKRYTHLSNKARRMAAAQPKLGQQRTWAARRLAAMEAKAATLRRIELGLQEAIGQLGRAATRLDEVREIARQGLVTVSAGLTRGFTLAGQLTPYRIKVRGSLAGAGHELEVIKERWTVRLAGVQSTLRDRLVRRAGAVLRASDDARVERGRAVAAHHLARATPRLVAAHDGKHSRLQKVQASVQRSLDRYASEVVAAGHAMASRLSGIGDCAMRLRTLDSRQLTLATTLERLGRRSSSAQVGALVVVLRLSSESKLRLDVNTGVFSKLAGMEAVARSRKEAIRRRMLVKAVDASLNDYKVLLGRIRATAAAAATTQGEIIARALQATKLRLASTEKDPQLLLWQALGQKLSTIEHVEEATPGRLEALQQHAHIRMTSTMNQMQWSIRGVQAPLRDLGHRAMRAHRLDLLIGQSEVVKVTLVRSSDRLATIRQTTVEALPERLSHVSKSLTAVEPRLGRARVTMQSLSETTANKPIAPSRAQDVKPSDGIGFRAEIVAPLPAEFSRRPKSQIPAAKFTASKTAALRKIVSSRTPEIDLHGPVPPAGRKPVPNEKPSAVAAMWQRLRRETEDRAPDVNATTLEQALQRLAASRAAITRDEEGLFTADDRGLFAEERLALRRAANQDLAQARLGELWNAQERRREAAAPRTGEINASAPPSPAVSLEEGVSLDVQTKFFAKLTGKGK